jgi:hypothetical protein
MNKTEGGNSQVADNKGKSTYKRNLGTEYLIFRKFHSLFPPAGFFDWEWNSSQPSSQKVGAQAPTSWDWL